MVNDLEFKLQGGGGRHIGATQEKNVHNVH